MCGNGYGFLQAFTSCNGGAAAQKDAMGSACIKGEREERTKRKQAQTASVELSQQAASEQSTPAGGTSGQSGSESAPDPSGPAKVPAYVEVQTAQQSSATVSGVQVEMAESTSHVFVVMGASVRVFLKPLSRIQGSSGMTHLLLIK